MRHVNISFGKFLVNVLFITIMILLLANNSVLR